MKPTSKHLVVTCSLLFIAVIVIIVLAALLAIARRSQTTSGSSPPSTTPGGETYYGKKIDALTSYYHGVKGDVYVVDNKRLRLRDFYYDGTAPAAFFWIGIKGRHPNQPDRNGITTPDENGRLSVLKKYDGADIVLTLPVNVTVDQLLWFSAWCRQFFQNFGHVVFADNLSVPSPTDIGQLTQLHHGVRSGQVTIIDHKTVLVRNFSYDGNGQDVFFVSGNGSNQSDSKLLIKVSRLDGGLVPLTTFLGSDVMLRFPGPTSVFFFRFLAVYSNQTAQTFGQVNFPEQLNVPPFTLDPVVKLP